MESIQYSILNHPVMTYSLWGNLVQDYVIAALVFFLVFALGYVFRNRILKKLAALARTTTTDLDNTAIDIIRSLRPPFYALVSVYVATLFLTLSDWIQTVLSYLLFIWVLYQIVIALSILIDYVLNRKMVPKDEPQTQSVLSVIARILKGVVWVIVILFALSNMGVNVTSFMATAGIGGIAIALALQSILGDLFSSFSIYFDKPFEVGDFIMTGEHMGVVERIGIKTTRLRALQGEELVISNQELTSSRVQNFKKLHERRAVFTFGVAYETPTDQVAEIPGIVQKIIEKIDTARFDRAHFSGFGDSDLSFEVVYFVLSSDYNVHMDVQQKILLSVKSELEKKEITFAYPTRTLYLHKSE